MVLISLTADGLDANAGVQRQLPVRTRSSVQCSHPYQGLRVGKEQRPAQRYELHFSRAVPLNWVNCASQIVFCPSFAIDLLAAANIRIHRYNSSSLVSFAYCARVLSTTSATRGVTDCCRAMQLARHRSSQERMTAYCSVAPWGVLSDRPRQVRVL